MHPKLLEIGPLTITWFGVMLAVGLLFGFGCGSILGRRRGWNVNFCSDFLFWMIIAGVLGGRLAYVISDIHKFIEHPLEIIRVDQGGLIYYGGFMGACVSVYLFAKIRRENPLALYDLAIVSVPLVHVFGRIGCFMNGCCFGKLHEGGLSIRFPHGSLAWAMHWKSGVLTPEQYPGQSLSVYPTQLFEAGFNLLLFFFLFWLYGKSKRAGMVAGAYLVAYPVERFLIEFIRGDERMSWAGLTIAQEISMVLFVLGCVILFRTRSKSKPEQAQEA